MKKGNKILTTDDVKHIETLLAKGLKFNEIAEIIGTSKSSVCRVKDGVHFLQRKPKEEAKPDEDKPEADTTAEAPQAEAKAEVMQELIRNQETIIQLLLEMLMEWRK